MKKSKFCKSFSINIQTSNFILTIQISLFSLLNKKIYFQRNIFEIGIIMLFWSRINGHVLVERAEFAWPRARRRRFAAQPLVQISSFCLLQQHVLFRFFRRLPPHWGRRQIPQGNSIRPILKKKIFIQNFEIFNYEFQMVKAHILTFCKLAYHWS